MSHLRFFALLVLPVAFATAACDGKENPSGPGKASAEPSRAATSRPTGTTTGAGTASAPPTSCTGDDVKDKVSGAFFAKKAGTYCVSGETKTFGENATFPKDKICTAALDGECEVYFGYGLTRLVQVTYADGAGKPNTINVNLTQFATPSGAYAMFTQRVVSQDPVAENIKVLPYGGATVMGGSNGQLWKGEYLAEFAFNSDDPNLTEDQMRKAAAEAIEPIARELGAKLPGTSEVLPAAKALPSEHLVPGGIRYLVKDPLAMKGVGEAAVGFYSDGGAKKRYRLIAIVRDTADHAKETMQAIKAKAGQAVADVGEEAVAVHLAEPTGPAAEAPGSIKIAGDYVFTRKGALVVGVSDEEYTAKDAATKLSKDEKVAKLKAWLASPPPGAAASSSPSASGSAARPAPTASGVPSKK